MLPLSALAYAYVLCTLPAGVSARFKKVLITQRTLQTALQRRHRVYFPGTLLGPLTNMYDFTMASKVKHSAC